MYKPRCVAPTGCLLGEGPVWSPSEGFVWWVDIKRAKLHRYNTVTGNARRYDLPIRASALAMWDGALLMAGDREVGRYDPETEAYDRLHALVSLPVGARTNDGGMTPEGDFIVGTMDDAEEESIGEYYLIQEDAQPRKLDLPIVTVTNTMQFSPDGKKFYTCDSTEQCIYVHDYEPITCVMSNRRVFSQSNHANGFPDGSAVDVEGGIWTAEWGAGQVVRRNARGRVTRVVDLPAPRPSSCAFGGRDLKTLFVTTARQGLPDRAFEANPLSGGLFAIDVEVAGCAVPEFGAEL